jgi:DNA-binding transcriptional LysR family regulator
MVHRGQPDIRQLEALHLLLLEPSPSKVAERLRLTQPAVSAILGKLRRYFGDPLFVQTGKEMVPTAFARSLQIPIREMLMQAEGVSQMRPNKELSTYQRTIRIAVSDFIATVLLTPVLRKALEAAPLLRFELVSVFDSRHHYHEDLERGDVDVLIIPHMYISEAHRQQFLLEEDYVCIACKQRKPSRKRLTLADFIGADHVGVTNRTVAGRPYDEVHLERLGIRRRIEIAVPTQLWIPQMIVGTNRLSLVHRHLAVDLCRRWPIRILPCPVEIPPLREFMQWHAYQDNDPAILWLKSEIMTASRELPLPNSKNGLAAP